MKIFGNCLVKNEADMIHETLVHALRWCDQIYVFDNGSTDGTWDIVCSLASKNARVVPYRSADVPYRDSLRAEVFNRYRDNCSPGDWWCKLDADELYYDDPRVFLQGVPRHHHVVWGVNFQFYFTDLDRDLWHRDPKAYPPFRSAETSLRFYRCEWSEVRFFRYRPRLHWTFGSAPRHLGIVHPRRIRFQHYQYRSPEQIELRLRTRQAAIASGCGTFQGYNDEKSWTQKVVPSTSCKRFDTVEGLVIEENRIPQHTEQLHVRAIKHFMHGARLWP